MRRLASLIAGSAVLLLVGAMPALADGGPHTTTINSGTPGISSDSCAGCHRTHTAVAPLLLVDHEPALCLTCHGSSGAGATTDVMLGIQYRVGASRGPESGVLGALRGGGFAYARINSGNAARITYTRRSGAGTVASPYTYPTSQLGMVPVLSGGEPVTSTHLDTGPAWGNGAINSGVGATTTLECTSCHNPHGNNQYRMLNPLPGDGSGALVEATTGGTVTDAPLPSPGDARNYTVIQRLVTGVTFSSGSPTTNGAPSGYLLYASQIDGVYGKTDGDYFHKNVPWTGRTDYTAQAADPLHAAAASVTNKMKDAPNGRPIDDDPSTTVDNSFDAQINAWCSQCHTRYLAIGTRPYETDSGDAIYTYRHSNTSDKPCTTCHVAHGTNAVMTGYAATALYPGDPATPVGGSRLLKIDNRGTCQACHDPTGTVPAGTYIGPNPSPVVP